MDQLNGPIPSFDAQKGIVPISPSIAQQNPISKPATTVQIKPPNLSKQPSPLQASPVAQKPPTTARPPYVFTTQPTIKPACGGCGVPRPTSEKPKGLPFQTPQFQTSLNSAQIPGNIPVASGNIVQSPYNSNSPGPISPIQQSFGNIYADPNKNSNFKRPENSILGPSNNLLPPSANKDISKPISQTLNTIYQNPGFKPLVPPSPGIINTQNDPNLPNGNNNQPLKDPGPFGTFNPTPSAPIYLDATGSPVNLGKPHQNADPVGIINNPDAVAQNPNNPSQTNNKIPGLIGQISTVGNPIAGQNPTQGNNPILGKSPSSDQYPTGENLNAGPIDTRFTENNKLSNPHANLNKLTVSNGVIEVPNNPPIKIVDKYPGMIDGLPEGVKQDNVLDLLYKFNYTVGFHGHYEKGYKNGAKVGGYFVNGRDGISRVVTYVADENGYRPKFKLINLGLDSSDTPKEGTEKMFGLKNFEFVWYPVK